MAKSKLARRRSKRKRNPENGNSKAEATKLAYSIGAGFAGYTATRFIARMAYSQAVKKFPGGAKHAAFAASAAGAAGAFFGSKHWGKVEDYHDEITIGAGIALAQSFVQSYIPQYGWIVGDLDESQYKKTAQKAPQAAAADLSALPLPPGVPETVPELPPTSDFDLDALLAEHGLEEGEQLGVLAPAGGMGDSGDGLGDYSDVHEETLDGGMFH
jgi:hypothetical protein